MSSTMVAVVSLKGGVGRTAIAAELGTILNRDHEGGALLVDLDPADRLGLAFGLMPGGAAGLARAALHDESWARAVRTRRGAPALLPFGDIDEAERDELAARMRRDPSLVASGLGDPLLARFDYVVLDVAPGPSPWFDRALACADLVLAVLEPDGASFATVPALEARLAACARGEVRWLLSRVDSTRRLARDVRAALAQRLGPALLPFVVHFDEAVREALAMQRSVLEHAPACQATADLERLAAVVANRAAARVARPAPRFAHEPLTRESVA